MIISANNECPQNNNTRTFLQRSFSFWERMKTKNRLVKQTVTVVRGTNWKLLLPTADCDEELRKIYFLVDRTFRSLSLTQATLGSFVLVLNRKCNRCNWPAKKRGFLCLLLGFTYVLKDFLSLSFSETLPFGRDGRDIFPC